MNMKQLNLCRTGKALLIKRIENRINKNKIPLISNKIKYVCSDSSQVEKREWVTSLKNSHIFEDLTDHHLIKNLNDELTSSPSSTNDTIKQENKNNILQMVPMVAKPDEHLASAKKRALNIYQNKKIKNIGARIRNLSTRRLDGLMKEMTVPLTKYLAEFPNIDKLHDFDRTRLDLTVNKDRYIAVLKKLNQFRKTLSEVGRSYAARAGNCQSKKEATSIMEEGFTTMENIYTKNQKILIDLLNIAKSLRRLPKVNTSIPTLALVGAPNVGKSSLVKIISSGKPEVCNYPFTTRSIKLGHFFVNGKRHQVTDTPGLLNRPHSKRNAMELLTLATLRHLPTTVVYVMDLTEECGTNIRDQLEIRNVLKIEFKEKDWIDVFTKSDLIWNEEKLNYNVNEVLDLLPNAFKVSNLTLDGIDVFKDEVMKVLGEKYSKF